MNFLSNKSKSKKEIASTEDSNTASAFLKPFALLQKKQLDRFTRALLEGYSSLYDKVYEKTGSRSFAKSVKKRSNMYKTKKGFEEYTYLAAFESLLSGMFGWGNDTPCSFLEYGEGEFFDENGFVVKYSKEEPLYERTHSKNEDGDYFIEAGIIQILYQSPIGNFVIKQNQVNNEIFEVYVSEDISEMLLAKLNRALEITLEIKPKSLEIKPKPIEKDFDKKYKVKIDNASPNIALQKKTIDMIAPSVEDSGDER